MPSTTLKTLRQKIIKKLYAPRWPIVSEITSVNTTSTITDTIITPAAQDVDFMRAWIYWAEHGRPTMANTATVNGAQTAADTAIEYTSAGDPFSTSIPYVLNTTTNEIIQISSIDVGTNTLTVTRGVLGTTAAAMSNGESLVTLGPVVGEITRVTNIGSNSLTVAPALSVASATTGLEYELHYKFHPVRVHEKINEILENLKHDMWDPLTLVTDGNMQTSGTGNWDDLSNATAAKQTSGTGVQFGTQCLRVTTSAANGYVESEPVYLRPGSRVFIAALAQIVSGTSPDATLQFIDVTNSDAVVESGTIDTLFRGNGIIAFEATVPATSSTQSVRLVGTSNDSVIDWNFVCVYPARQRQFALSSAFEWPEDFKDIYYLELGDGIDVGNSSNAYNAWEHVFRKWGEGSIFRNDTADIPYRIERRDARNINKVLFVKGRIDYGVFTTTGGGADLETTVAPDDILIDLTYAALLDEWATELRDNNQLEEAQRKEEKASKVRMELSPRMQEFFKQHIVVQGTIRAGEPN